MSGRKKISFSNIDLETIKNEVEELEDNTIYTTGSVSKAYWAHSLYCEFLDAIGSSSPEFPLNSEVLKPCLLELSKVYLYKTVKSFYLCLRRAWSIINKSEILPALPEVKNFLKLLKKNYADRIANSEESLQQTRKPLLPATVYSICDNLDTSTIGIRDKSLLLTNMIIGQRCDSLQYVELRHLSWFFIDSPVNKKRAFYIVITKEKDNWLEVPRKRLVTTSQNSNYCPVYWLACWIYIRGIFRTQLTFEELFSSSEDLNMKGECLSWPLWFVFN
jgi:hypothetical protein